MEEAGEGMRELQPRLDETEARVLGVLVEKAATTPEQYPLTANAAAVGSNQKTSRDPLMNLELGAVGHALRTLEDKKLVRVQHAARAYRYEHRFDEVYGVTPQQRAALCMLLLRGPQTVAELFARCDRLARFADQEQMRDTLDRLCRRQPAMAQKLSRLPGQREERYMHLLCGQDHADRRAAAMACSEARNGGGGENDSLLGRIEALEAQVAELRTALVALGALDASEDAPEQS